MKMKGDRQLEEHYEPQQGSSLLIFVVWVTALMTLQLLLDLSFPPANHVLMRRFWSLLFKPRSFLMSFLTGLLQHAADLQTVLATPDTDAHTFLLHEGHMLHS